MCGPARNTCGLTLIEIIMTMAIVSIIMGGIVMFMDRVVHFKATADTMQRFKKVENAFELMYEENIRYIEDNCYGWTDPDPNLGCNAITVLPVVSSGINLIVATGSDAVRRAFLQAGCTGSSQVSPDTFTCLDGYGRPFVFSADHQHGSASIYANGYARVPYTITIQSGGNASMSDTWTSSYLDSEHMTRSQEKILTVARAMKSYHLSRLTYESISNPCTPSSGGLASNDDIFIPWIWQALGSGPAQKCTGIDTSPCGCSSFGPSIWPTDPALNRVTTKSTITSFYMNINVGSRYRVDGFGNPITIVLLATPAGSSVGLAPNRPYPSYAWSVSPPYGGLVAVFNGIHSLHSERVVYVQ